MGVGLYDSSTRVMTIVKKTFNNDIYKIILRIVCALSLVNRCVWMRVCKQGCDISQILIGCVVRSEF